MGISRVEPEITISKIDVLPVKLYLEISGVEPEITICKIDVLPVKLYPL